ncbi:hypothetical protein BT63DRAFT_113611 [Microthyrium microscopicum]|uniref:Zn(2)-C6 fungal-type domain-containing protein n=1 Tax=Microthyrium microscopicum TaxID=703497 RepID=A0A6A6TUW8_9PEZI|nr:hypothetical protein BT63DRAFT_113611 [Microthyrium microscopicum]
MDPLDDRQNLKRKRTPDPDGPISASPAPPAKTSKTNHLAINYLARQTSDDLPLISHDDTLQNILLLLTEYHGVIDRHESMAFNLGAKPLGPILIKRFERWFESPPKVLKCHGKEGTTVSWLDVVEFARNKPEQFTLGQMSEGVRVCQFYTKQCRVQISEEDYVMISSDIPQRLIPPQPVIEDEEKELGTLEIMESNLTSIFQMADQVAARGRQLRHRIIARKQAIIDRRASDPAFENRAASPSNIALINGNGNSASPGFTAVNNTRQVTDSSGHTIELSKVGATEGTIQELLKQFSTVRLLRRMANGEVVAPGQSQLIGNAARSSTTPGNRPDGHLDSTPLNVSTSSPQIFSTPSSIIPKADDGPYKQEMVARMESVKRGERILPPCDRCRRLHMDCIKNLTACAGCTKKHAKCGWKDVRLEELATPPTGAPAESNHDLSPQYENRNRHNGSDLVKPTSNGTMFNSDTPSVGGASLPNVRSLTMDAAAAAGLAAVAKASAAALESSEAEQRRSQGLPEQTSHPTTVQSPNLIHQNHHSPNMPSYGEFSPGSNNHHSVNMPFASGRRPSSDIHSLTTGDMDGGELRDEKHPLESREGEGLLNP